MSTKIKLFSDQLAMVDSKSIKLEGNLLEIEEKIKDGK
jgi:hypothetical protein